MNYAIVKSLFGDHWIGKTKLPVKDGAIFDNFNDALEEAKTFAAWGSVAEMELAFDLDEIEIIKKKVEKFII